MKLFVRSLIEKLGKWNSGSQSNKDNFRSGINVIIDSIFFLIPLALLFIWSVLETIDDLVDTDAEKKERQAMNDSLRQWKTDRNKTIEKNRLLSNAHPNVKKALEAKGLKLSCGIDENYTITFDDQYVYVKGDLNFKSDLEYFLRDSTLDYSGFVGGIVGSDIFEERKLYFETWKRGIQLSRKIPNTLRLRPMGPPEFKSCRETFNDTSNNPWLNSTSKPKEPKLSSVPASKKIQEIRKSVKNRTHDKSKQ